MFRSSREGPTEEKAGRHTLIRLGAALIAAVGMVLGPLALAASATSAPHAAAPVQGYYVPVTPFRITDTRTGSGQPNAGMTPSAAATLPVQVTGLGTVPAGASAAVLNVTAVDPTASGFLTVFPEGELSLIHIYPSCRPHGERGLALSTGCGHPTAVAFFRPSRTRRPNGMFHLVGRVRVDPSY